MARTRMLTLHPFSRLLETGEYADFTVICGDREWKTHKAVLARCDYFKTAITMGFKVCNGYYFTPKIL